MESTERTEAWKMLSPLAIVFFAGAFIRQIIGNGIPAIAGALAWASTLDGDWTERLIRIGVAVLGVTLVYAFTAYWRFRYRLGGKQILLKRGVFQREQLSVDVDRVQNVNIRRPFFARWFGLSLVDIDTAGSKGHEIQLAGIPHEQGIALREVVLSTRADGEPVYDAAPDELAPLYGSTPRDLVCYGLSNPSVVLAAIIGTIAGQYADEYVYERIFNFQFFQQVRNWLDMGNEATTAAAVGAIIFGVVIFLSLISIAAAFLRFHRFQLRRRGSTLVAQAGLVTTAEKSLPYNKIQTLVLRQNPVLKLFKRVNVEYRQSSEGDSDPTSSQNASARRFVIPAVPSSQVDQVIRETVPGWDFQNVAYTRPDLRMLPRVWFLSCALPLIAGPAIGSIWAGYWVLALIPASLLIYPFFRRWWKLAGFGTSGEIAVVRHGIVGYKTSVFEMRKTQGATLKSSPRQRRLGLATIDIHLASQTLSFPYADAIAARTLVDLCLYSAESSDEPWF